MSQINQILERIARIQATIQLPTASGIAVPVILQAEPYQPSDMKSVSAPFFVNEVRPSPADIPIANGIQYRTTTIDMMLAVERRLGNTDLKFGLRDTAEWTDAVFAMFAQHVRLSAPQVLIASSTNANPIVVTTTTPHCLASPNDQVTISGHTVNTNANGVWNATTIDPVTFSIPVAGNGVGGATGVARMTQPADMVNFVLDAVIQRWDLVDWAYGSSPDPSIPNWLALDFQLLVEEMYQQTLAD